MGIAMQNGAGGVTPDFNEVINTKIHDGGTQSCPSSSGTSSHGLYISSNNNLFDRVESYNNGQNGMQLYPSGNNNVIRNSIFRNNGLAGFSSDGIVLYGSGNQVYNNLFYNNTCRACRGVSLHGSSQLVYNNTVTGNSFGVDFAGSGHIVKNSIVYNNAGSQFEDNGGVTYSNNLCGSSGTGCAVIGNPLFVDAANGNFYLQAGSPAINAGTSSIASGTAVSFDGSAPYIGALPYIGTSTTGSPPSAPSNLTVSP
jgi:hypothetical protein